MAVRFHDASRATATGTHRLATSIPGVASVSTIPLARTVSAVLVAFTATPSVDVPMTAKLALAPEVVNAWKIQMPKSFARRVRMATLDPDVAAVPVSCVLML